MATVLVAPKVNPKQAERRVESRLTGVHGVRVLGSGLEGRQVYVDIAAHSVQAADFARDALTTIAGITEEAWSRGWALRGADLTLRLYPS